MCALCHVFFRDLRNLLWTKTTVFKEQKHSGKPWFYFEKVPLFTLNAVINFEITNKCHHRYGINFFNTLKSGSQ